MINKYEKWYENIDEYSKLEQYIENIFVKLLNINSIKNMLISALIMQEISPR